MKRRFMVMVHRVVNRIVRLTRMQRFRGAGLLCLTAVGRKSGKSRTVPLAYVRDDADYIVAADASSVRPTAGVREQPLLR